MACEHYDLYSKIMCDNSSKTDVLKVVSRSLTSSRS